MRKIWRNHLNEYINLEYGILVRAEKAEIQKRDMMSGGIY